MTTLTAPASVWRRLLAVHHTAAKPSDPHTALHGVWLQGHGDRVTATATDRYALAVAQAPIDAPNGLSVVLPPAAIKAVNSVKVTKRDDPTIALDLGGNYVRVIPEGQDGQTFPLILENYPSVTRLLASRITAAQTPQEGRIVTDLALLGPFSRMVDKGEPVTITATGENQPYVVEARDLIGLVNQIRLYETPYTNDWSMLTIGN